MDIEWERCSNINSWIPMSIQHHNQISNLFTLLCPSYIFLFLVPPQSISPYQLLPRASTPERLRMRHNSDQMRKYKCSTERGPLTDLDRPGQASNESRIDSLSTKWQQPNLSAQNATQLNSGSLARHKYYLATSAQLNSLSQTFITPQ